MNIDQAIDRARKLFALATSNNPHEAAQAAARAQEILDRYEITQAMLDADNDVDDEEEIENFAEKGAPLDTAKALASWKKRLAMGIAEANQCLVYSGRARGKRAIQIIGRPSDVQKVRYMYDYLVRETDQLTKHHARGCGHTWANNFRHGVVDTLRSVLEATRAKVAADMRAAADGSLALVRVDNALIKLEDRTKAVELYAKVRLNLRVTSHSARGNRGARERGREAGREIKLGNARGALGSGQRWVGNAS